MDDRAGCGPTNPRPVAYTVTSSPGIAGLKAVTGAPAMLAQHSEELIAVMVSVGLEVVVTPVVTLVVVWPTTEAPIVRPLPALPGIFARSRIRVNDPDAVATTFSSPFALISA